MKKYLPWVAILAVIACNESPTKSTPAPVATAAPTATPTPAPTPNLSLVGFWKFTGHFNGEPLGVMNGYGFDIDSHNVATGEFRGRSVFPVRGLTGLMVGTVSPSGKVVWQTRYCCSDTENGTMQLNTARTRMDGEVIFQLPSINFNIRYFNMLMDRQP